MNCATPPSDIIRLEAGGVCSNGIVMLMLLGRQAGRWSLRCVSVFSRTLRLGRWVRSSFSVPVIHDCSYRTVHAVPT